MKADVISARAAGGQNAFDNHSTGTGLILLFTVQDVMVRDYGKEVSIWNQ